MEELNGREMRVTSVVDWNTFTIGDTRSFSEYMSGGGVAKSLKSQTISDIPREEARLELNERQRQIDLGFTTLERFIIKNGRLPGSWNKNDSAELIRLAHLVDEESDSAKRLNNIDEALLSAFSHVSKGKIAPLTSIICAIVAQEAIKICTKKLPPLRQFVFDAMTCLPDGDGPLEEDCQPLGSPQDDQVQFKQISLADQKINFYCFHYLDCHLWSDDPGHTW